MMMVMIANLYSALRKKNACTVLRVSNLSVQIHNIILLISLEALLMLYVWVGLIFESGQLVSEFGWYRLH